MHKMGSDPLKDKPLAERFKNQAPIPLLQITDPPMDNFRRSARCSASEIPFFEKEDAQTALGGVPRNPGTQRPAADYDKIVSILF
jgi:hypothetical protein